LGCNADDPLELMGQAAFFRAFGRFRQDGRGLLRLAGVGEDISGGDAFDDRSLGRDG
jgi:hypothetical protein